MLLGVLSLVAVLKLASLLAVIALTVVPYEKLTASKVSTVVVADAFSLACSAFSFSSP